MREVKLFSSICGGIRNHGHVERAIRQVALQLCIQRLEVAENLLKSFLLFDPLLQERGKLAEAAAVLHARAERQEVNQGP